MNRWLITGGAGYIGAHVVQAFRAADIDVVVLDNLSTGVQEKIPSNTKFYKADLKSMKDIQNIFSENTFEGVIHLAAKKSVIESMHNPEKYFEENLIGLSNLLKVMKVNEVDKLVYSSSSSVYGEQQNKLAKENDLLRPVSFYGKTKLMGEWMIEASENWGLKYIFLRYFNVAGAGNIELSDVGEYNLIPMVFRALLNKEKPKIFGDQYPTPDGTCIRDFIHVEDVSAAHVVAAEKLINGMRSQVFNVGTGKGTSVKDVIEIIREETGYKFEIEIAKPRPGDPPFTGADTTKINEMLGWFSNKTIEETVRSAWQAWEAKNKINS